MLLRFLFQAGRPEVGSTLGPESVEDFLSEMRGAASTSAEDRLRREIVRECRRLVALGLVGAREGNLSARTGDGSLLVSPSGARKEEIQPAELVRVPLAASGAAVPRRSKRQPSSELALHLAIYRAFPAVRAVAHAHPLCVLALDRAGLPIEVVMPESDLPPDLPIPAVPPLPSGSQELARAAVEALARSGSSVAVLSGHGAVACGPDIRTCVDRLEILERSARLALLTRLARVAVDLPSNPC